MDLGNAKILIGDDSILARKQLKDCIAALGGSNFIEAANGQEAIDKYKSEQPDIVFLDIVMPIKDGIVATQEIHDLNPKACIIMVSSVGTIQQLKAAIEAGAKDFVQKPFSGEQVAAVLDAHLGGN